jgi:chromosome partitioning protein
MPVVTVCNHKGGTGKTTTVIHLAAAAGLSGRRTLVVDFDPQGFLTRMLGAEEPAPEQTSLALLHPEADLRKMPVLPMSGFDLLPASYAMNKAQRSLTRPTDVFWLKETLAAGHDYDLLLLDTAAALSVFTMNALVASEHVLIPVTPEYQPVVGAEQTWQTSRLVRQKLNPALNDPLFLLTQVDARKRDHHTYAQHLRGLYGDCVMRRVIRTSAALAESSHDGRTVFDHDLTSRGARDYANAADELSAHFFAPSAEGAPDAEPAPADERLDDEPFPESSPPNERSDEERATALSPHRWESLNRLL